MSYKGTKWSKTQYYRRLKQANRLGCSINDLPDNRGKHGRHAKGSTHHRWNSGRIVSSEGYTKIRVGIEHPLSDPNGYAYEHVLVWVSAGNEKPNAHQIIHHANEDKADNRIENLEVMTRSEHNAHHNDEKQRDKNGQFIGRICTELDGRTWGQYPKSEEAHD